MPLVAGDLDHAGFEQGLPPEVIVRWVALPSLWRFWRGGKLAKQPIEKALVTAYELGLLDAKWLLDTIEAGGGKLRRTDVLAEGLSKAELTAWVRRVHESGWANRRRSRSGDDPAARRDRRRAGPARGSGGCRSRDPGEWPPG